MLAFTTDEGQLIRWTDSIPAGSPDPIKSVGTLSTTRTVHRHATPALFLDDAAGDSTDPKPNEANDDIDTTDAFVNDDWILDDLDGALDDGPEAEVTGGNGFVKEMGKLPII